MASLTLLLLTAVLDPRILLPTTNMSPLICWLNLVLNATKFCPYEVVWEANTPKKKIIFSRWCLLMLPLFGSRTKNGTALLFVNAAVKILIQNKIIFCR